MRQIVTEWFRIPAVWPLLAATLAGLGRPVTVWSGACGTGEEAYSAAILLHDHGIPGQVLASDLDADLLKVAERGRYDRANIDTNLREGRLSRPRSPSTSGLSMAGLWSLRTSVSVSPSLCGSSAQIRRPRVMWPCCATCGVTSTSPCRPG